MNEREADEAFRHWLAAGRPLQVKPRPRREFGDRIFSWTTVTVLLALAAVAFVVAAVLTALGY